MNLIQKHKSKTIKVFLNQEDISSPISKLAISFSDLLELCPLDYSLKIDFGNLEDLPLEFTGLLLSLIKTINDGQISITLLVHSKLSDLLLSLGTGSLRYSIELNEEIQ